MSTYENEKERTAMLSARRIALAMVALLALTVAVPRGASATSQVPFQASIAETFTAGPCGTNACIAFVGSGQATHLGHTSETGQVVVDLSSHPPGPGLNCNNNTRTETLTGADGDQLTVAITGVNCDSGATTGITGMSHDSFIVTGGTGRYSGATGSGTDTVYVDGPDLTATTVFSGTLSTPGSLQ
jgi:hypothetical protein